MISVRRGSRPTRLGINLSTTTQISYEGYRPIRGMAVEQRIVNSHPGAAKSHLGAAKSGLGAANSALGCANSGLARVNADLGAAKSRLGCVEFDLGAAKSRLGRVKSDLGPAKSRLARVKSHLGAAKSHLGRVNSRPTRANSHLGRVFSHPRRVFSHLGRVKCDLGAAKCDFRRRKCDLGCVRGSGGAVSASARHFQRVPRNLAPAVEGGVNRVGHMSSRGRRLVPAQPGWNLALANMEFLPASTNAPSHCPTRDTGLCFATSIPSRSRESRARPVFSGRR